LVCEESEPSCYSTVPVPGGGTGESIWIVGGVETDAECSNHLGKSYAPAGMSEAVEYRSFGSSDIGRVARLLVSATAPDALRWLLDISDGLSLPLPTPLLLGNEHNQRSEALIT
jgi:hypothetical protein